MDHRTEKKVMGGKHKKISMLRLRLQKHIQMTERCILRKAEKYIDQAPMSGLDWEI
jgi:hypothetical protein